MTPQFPGSILDIEYYLPGEITKNSYFKDNFPEWNVEQAEKRTGVLERHIASEGETAYDLALVATKKLLEKHPILLKKIDAIIFCTQSPDYVMPSNAFLIHRDLGLKTQVLAFDYNLACSGYIYGLLMASSFIKTGIVTNVLLITADTYSKYLDENDRSTRMLFGDGASASWIGHNDGLDFCPLIRSFDDFECASDGKGWDKFIVKSGGSRYPTLGHDSLNHNPKIFMNGLHVLNFVSDRVIRQIVHLLEKNSLRVDQIDQFFLHQASALAIDSIEKRLKINKKQIFSNIESIGNTVSSSIPILIKDYFSQSSLPQGSKLFICGFGVGYSWGSLLASK